MILPARTLRVVFGLAFFPLAWSGQPNVEFDLVGRLILVPGTANEREPLTLIVDTGATETILTPAAAQRLQLRTLPPLAGHTIGSVDSISVGAATVRKLLVFVEDPPAAKPLRERHGADYDGILGCSFLQQFVITIDYAEKRVRFSRPAPPRKIEGARLDFRDRLLYVSGQVNGHGPILFLLDTGSAETILLPEVAKRLQIKTVSMPSAQSAGFAQAVSIAVGNRAAQEVPVVVYTPFLADGQRRLYEGILGTTFLSKFHVTIDYPGRRLQLQPTQ